MGENKLINHLGVEHAKNCTQIESKRKQSRRKKKFRPHKKCNCVQVDVVGFFFLFIFGFEMRELQKRKLSLAKEGKKCSNKPWPHDSDAYLYFGDDKKLLSRLVI